VALIGEGKNAVPGSSKTFCGISVLYIPRCAVKETWFKLGVTGFTEEVF
jgi:hypothetical protein